MTAPVSSVPPPVTSGSAFLLLIFRGFVGYGVLFVCLLLLLRRAPWDLSTVDIVYWVTLAAILFLHRRAGRESGAVDGWPRLVLQHVAIAGGLWAAAHCVLLIR